MALFPDPFDALVGLQQALDSFRTSDWLRSGPSAGGAYPPLNVFRKGGDFILIAELPGIQKADLDIQVNRNTIRLAGSKEIGYPEKASLHRRERLVRPLRSRHNIAGRDRRGRRQSRVSRRGLGSVAATRGARKAEIYQGELTMSGQFGREMEGSMASSQELTVRDKKEMVSKEENTTPGRYFVPYTDIHETEDGLNVIMEMPGVDRDHLNVSLENDVLRVDGQIDFSRYEGMEPVYTRYNVGHYTRSFTLSKKIDQDRIGAQLEGGVLTLTLPKAKEARGRRIAVN